MGDKAMTEALGRLQLNDNEAVLETLQRLRHVISRFLFFHEGTKAEYDRAMAERALISAMIVEYDLPLSANVKTWRAFEDTPVTQEPFVGISNPAPLSAFHTTVSQSPLPPVPEDTSTNLMEEVD